MRVVSVDGETLTLEAVREVAERAARAEVSGRVVDRVEKARGFVERLVGEHEIVYGLTTGFGSFADVRIPDDDLLALQRNLVLSHCCGVGEPLRENEVRAMMLLRANVIAKGYSGARPAVLQTLLQMLDRGVHPIIPTKGSVGASGDLAPLAHLAAVMIGEGEAIYEGRRLPGGEAMREAGIEPLVLQAKEGLALINGTQFMTALGVLAQLQAENLALSADIAGAMTLEALWGTDASCHPLTHELRPYSGQQASARNIRKLLEGSEILPHHRDRHVDRRVQDAYSLRCMPQVHGTIKEGLSFVRRVLAIEVNAATDNPLVFPEEKVVISGGNFHGQPVAQALDFLAISMATLAGISERRLESMLDPATSDRLPAFLTERGGLNSGIMITQVTAASLVSENKTLAHPASVDSIPTSANKEDFVSMGAFAARKAREVVENTMGVLAIELLCAAQALEFGGGLRPGRGVRQAYDLIRQVVPPLEADRPFSPDIEAIISLIRDRTLVRTVAAEVGGLELA